jgi:hypothetical protein
MMTISAALALAVVSLAGCGLVHGPREGSPPTPSLQATSTIPPSPRVGGLEVDVLSGEGPNAAYIPALIAGHSVAELKAILHGLPVRFHDPDGWDSHREKNRIFLSLSVGFCTSVTAVRATLDSADSVTIAYTSKGVCGPGIGTAGIPRLWLLSIAADRLPARVVSFHFAGESREAMVDLRLPPPAADPEAIAAAAQMAVNAALRAIGSTRQVAVLELDLMRWPDGSLGCGPLSASAPSQPVLGFVVVVNKAPDATPRPNEFHWAAGALVDCGAPAR